jgi:hypothetical protein
MKQELSQKPQEERHAGWTEFAMPLWYQFLVCVNRMFEQFWRTPAYIYSKFFMCIIPVSPTKV